MPARDYELRESLSLFVTRLLRLVRQFAKPTLLDTCSLAPNLHPMPKSLRAPQPDGLLYLALIQLFGLVGRVGIEPTTPC